MMGKRSTEIQRERGRRKEGGSEEKRGIDGG